MLEAGGSQHGPPPPEMPSPVSSRPPQHARTGGDLEESESERGALTGSRWPRDETLALLKIRSEMDAEFRESTFKSPLWEEVSRRLAALGYQRGAKKCREKFENVHKYYKRTKDHRAGRPDGRSYRFFTELEALYKNNNASSISNNNNNAAAFVPPPPPTIHHPTPLSSIPPPILDPTSAAHSGPGPGLFSVTSSSDSDTEEMREGLRKRKRVAGGGRMQEMMAFFEGIMKEVMDRQEAMQQRFLEAIEKRENERMIREDAWRRQELARVTSENDLAALERAAAAGRDAVIMALLQKLASQVEPIAAPPAPAVQFSAPAAGGPQPRESGLPAEGGGVDCRATSPEALAVQEQQMEVALSGGSEPVSSRWPKAEVQSLIEIRTRMEGRYQEAGPKGPLWEEISAAMKRIGYNRSSKRCKEKWENINKYFKRVKESNKKRPEDAKTCPYFHQLDALYRTKSHSDGGIPVASPPPRDEQRPVDGSAEEVREQSSDGERSASVREGGIDQGASLMKKPEDILKELMDEKEDGSNSQGWACTRAITEKDRYNMEVDSLDGGEEEDHINAVKQKISYNMESQMPKVGGSSNSNMDKPRSAGGSNFLTIVQ